MAGVTMQPKSMRCAIYARISPMPEGKAGSNFSIQSQLHENREKALREFGCANSAEYIDDKVSGGSLDRPALDQLRDAIALKLYDVVIVYSPDRWTREPEDKMILNREIAKGGARVVYVTVSYEDTAEGGFAEDVQDAVSKYEKRKFKERARRCRRQKSREGYPHACVAPDGYRYEGHEFGKRGEYIIVPDRAKVVRQIYERAAQGGLTTYGLARWLNERKIKTQKGFFWSRQSVWQVVKKTAYYGEMTQNGETIKVPAIIDRGLWDRAHAALDSNKLSRVGRPPRQYLLCGLLWCRRCGKRSTTFPNHGYPAYRCNRVDLATGLRKCLAPMISTRALEVAVWDAVWDTVCDPDLLWEMIEAYYDRAGAKKGKGKDPGVAEILNARRKVAHAEKVLLDPDEPIPYAKAKANLEAARRDLAAVETKRGLAAVVVMPERKDVEAASARFRKMRDGIKSFDARREALCLLVEKILYADREAHIHCRLAAPTSSKCNRHAHDDCNLIAPIPFVISATIPPDLVGNRILKGWETRRRKARAA